MATLQLLGKPRLLPGPALWKETPQPGKQVTSKEKAAPRKPPRVFLSPDGHGEYAAHEQQSQSPSLGAEPPQLVTTLKRQRGMMPAWGTGQTQEKEPAKPPLREVPSACWLPQPGNHASSITQFGFLSFSLFFPLKHYPATKVISPPLGPECAFCLLPSKFMTLWGEECLKFLCPRPSTKQLGWQI